MKFPDLTRLNALQQENDTHAEFMEMQLERFQRLKNRHENGDAPRAVSAWQLFQTPEGLAEKLVELAEPAPGLSWLEPSAGLGRILRPILETRPGSVTAVEISTELAAELYRNFESVTLIQGDFMAREEFKFFDRVSMNPPFHMREDIRHISKAYSLLAPGGVLTGICMNSKHREEKIRGEFPCDYWERMQAGTFKEAGTKVETVLFRLRKPA